MSSSTSVILTEEKFNTLIEKYSNKFSHTPKSTKQLSSFCKEYGDNNEKQISYSQIGPFFYKYINKQKHNKKTIEQNILSEGINDDTITKIDGETINFNEYWDNYIKLYKYKPKNAKQLFNYLKIDNNINIKYKDVRLAFNKLDILGNDNVNTINIDGDNVTNNVINKENKNEIRLIIYDSTNDKVKNEIKELFVSILNKYKAIYNCYPKTAWNLFNYINDETEYKVKYKDIKFIMKYGLNNKWYTNDSKPKSVKKETQKAKKINKMMTLDEYNEIITEYKKEFNNKPKNAIQLMNFVNEYMKKGYKYNVIRIAFMKYHS